MEKVRNKYHSPLNGVVLRVFTVDFFRLKKSPTQQIQEEGLFEVRPLVRADRLEDFFSTKFIRLIRGTILQQSSPLKNRPFEGNYGL